MISYNQPRRLEIIAQTVIAECISQLCLRFSQLDSTQQLHASQVCKYLHFKLHSMVPHVLANDLTSEILKHLDYCYKDIESDIDEPLFQEKLRALVKTVLHPKITVLDLTWDWMFVTDFIVEVIDSAYNLRVLKLKRNIFDTVRSNVGNSDRCTQILTYKLHTLKDLQILSIMFCCNDALLEIACDSCKYLKVLDVRGSRNVTDKSISHILKLKYLEELQLSGTFVTEDGYLCLKKDLILERRKKLKTFDFDCYSTSQLISAREFENLMNISLVVRKCNVSVLKYLEKIKILKLKCGDFTSVKDLLVAKGDQLLKLKLDLDFNAVVDLKFVAEHCPSLQSLKVLGDTNSQVSNDDLVFCTITSLRLQTKNSSSAEYLVSRCKNLSKLTLCADMEFYNHSLERIFLKNSMDSLKELTIGSLTDDITQETLSLVTAHCMNLNTFKIFGCTYNEMERLCKLFPGISFTSRWQLPKFEVTFRKR